MPYKGDRGLVERGSWPKNEIELNISCCRTHSQPLRIRVSGRKCICEMVYINSYNRSIDHTLCRMQHGVGVTWRFIAACNAPAPG